MAVKAILRMGDPRLLQVADGVSASELPGIGDLVQDMLDTMRSANGAGLAAPQIGIRKRVVVFGIEQNPRYPDADPVPLTILVNPRITVLDDAMDEDWEGCLSVPGMRGLVPRYSHIRYSGITPSGVEIRRDVSGFHARVVQHECDHLDGVLYPMRMTDLRMFGFEEVILCRPDLGQPPQTEGFKGPGLSD